MANRTRFKMTGLAALRGRIVIRHSSGSQSSGGRKITTFDTQNVQRVSSNAGNRRSRKA